MFSVDGGVRTNEIRDGLSYTIALVESKRDIPWTRPSDVLYFEGEPLPELGGWFEDGWHAGLADGSTMFVSRDSEQAPIRAAFTIGDFQGEGRPQLTRDQSRSDGRSR